MKYKRLSECAEYRQERTRQINFETYISTENILPNKAGISVAQSLPDTKTTSKYLPNDILLSNIRPYFKKIWFSNREGGCSNDVLVVTAKLNYIPKFLYYVLSDNNFFNYDTVTSKGTKMPRGTPKAIMKYLVPDVNIEYQKKIISILSKYDSLIETNNKRIKILEQMAEELYKEWFVRFRFPGHENAEFKNGKPISWKQERLEEFGITLDSGSRPSGGIDNSIKEGVPSIGAESVKALGEFDYEGVKLIPEDYYSKLRRGKNTGEDILVYKDGAYIGKVTIFMNGFPYKRFAVNEHVFLLNANNKLFQYYLYFTLHMPEYFALMQNLNRNAAQPGLSKPDMKRIKILVPESSLVHSFNVVIKPILDEIFKLSSEKKILQKQRDLLLPRLMSGKLEV